MHMTLRLGFIVFFLFVAEFRGAFSQSLEEGDQCSLKDGTQGICKLLINCQAEIDSLQKGEFPSKICRFKGPQVIVCCKDTSPVIKITPKPASPASPRTTGEISKKKCKEYSQYAYHKIPITNLSTGKSEEFNRLDCAYERPPPAFEDVQAREGEFPHMALIGIESDNEIQWQCGGSLISENFILTAAHCLRNRHLGPPKVVRVGMQESAVSEVIVSPEFNNTAYHDIGLIRLSKKIDLNPNVRPACLQTERTIRTNMAMAFNWETGFSDAINNHFTKELLKFTDVEKCNMAYSSAIGNPHSKLKEGVRDDLMICAEPEQSWSDICQGNSGGPLQVHHNDEDIKCMYDIVGVTSFGKSCGFANNEPLVFTRVSAYLKWIEDTVWPQ